MERGTHAIERRARLLDGQAQHAEVRPQNVALVAVRCAWCGWRWGEVEGVPRAGRDAAVVRARVADGRGCGALERADDLFLLGDLFTKLSHLGSKLGLGEHA